MWSHTVAILVGGQSRRMGKPKHRVQLPNGKTMIDMMIEFAESTASTVVIVGGEVEGIQSIHDYRNQQGPVAGIEALLISGVDEQYLVVGCDMPQLQPVDVQPLLSCEGNAVFSYENHILGLPLKISQELLSNCTSYLDSKKRSIKSFISLCPHTPIPINSSQLKTMTSVNTPEEIAQLFKTE